MAGARLPRRAWIALLSSGALHVAALAVFGFLRVDNPAWNLAVDPGQAVSLMVVAAGPEEPTEPDPSTTAITLAPRPVPRLPSDVAPQEVVPLRPVAVPSKDLLSPAPAIETSRSVRPPAPAESELPELVDRVDPPPRAAPRVPGMSATALIPISQPFSGEDPGASHDVEALKLPSNPAPEYPLAARQRNEEGRVLLLVSLNADGRVTGVQLRASSGSDLLDDAALRAVRQWRFSPARSGGQRVASQLLVPVRFSLREAG